jgi:hypothetical protein
MTTSPRFTMSSLQYRQESPPTPSRHVRTGLVSLPRGFGDDIPQQSPVLAYRAAKPAPNASPSLSSDRGSAEPSFLLLRPLTCHASLHVIHHVAIPACLDNSVPNARASLKFRDETAGMEKASSRHTGINGRVLASESHQVFHRAARPGTGRPGLCSRKMRKSFLNGAGTLYIQGANGLTHLQGAPRAIAP